MTEENFNSDASEEAGKLITLTQAQLDNMIGDRVKREKEKFADYEDMKAEIEAHKAQLAAQLTELDSANSRYAAAEREIAELARVSQLQAVADAAGVPVSCLAGSTADRAEAIALTLEAVGIDLGRPRSPEPDHTQGHRNGDPAPSDPVVARLTKAVTNTR